VAAHARLSSRHRAARRLGASFRFGVEVREITVGHGRAAGVHAASGHIASGAVLVAAGAWSACLLAGLGVNLALRPRRGQILVTEIMPPLLSSIVLHSPYLTAKLNDSNDRPATLVMEQTAAGNLLVGSTRSYAGLDVRNTPEGIDAVAAQAARLAPAVTNLNIIRCFAGLRPCSGDGLPLVGPVPAVEGLFVATGHEGDGVALAPITGQIVARGMSDDPQEWLSELLPGR
jgi:sarcosine oxidase subunit beta